MSAVQYKNSNNKTVAKETLRKHPQNGISKWDYHIDLSGRLLSLNT